MADETEGLRLRVVGEIQARIGDVITDMASDVTAGEVCAALGCSFALALGTAIDDSITMEDVDQSMQDGIDEIEDRL